MARAAGAGNESRHDENGRLLRYVIRSADGSSGRPEKVTGTFFLATNDLCHLK